MAVVEDITVLDPSSVANLRSDVVEAKMQMANAPPEIPAPPPKKQPKKQMDHNKQAEIAGKKLMDQQKEKEEEARKAYEQEQKQKCLDKISLYRDKFKHLKKRNTVSAKSSLEEIEDEVHYIEMQLGSSEPGADNPACMALVAGMTGVEYVTENHYNPLNLNLTNLGKTTRDNIDKFEPLLDELMIKYGAKMVVSVEWRLTLMITTTIMTVHAANNGMHWPSKIQAAAEKAGKRVESSSYKDI